MHKEKLGIFYAILTCFVYSMMSMTAKLATEVPIITLIFFKSLICCSILSPKLFKKPIIWKVKNKKLIFLRIFFAFLNLICFYYAAKNLNLLADAMSLSSTGNLLTPFVIFFWDKIKIPMMRIIFISISFMGVLIVLNPSFDCLNIAGIAGIISGISIAFINVIVRKLSKTEHTNTIIFYLFIGMMIMSFFPMIYYWKNFENPIMWLYIILLGIFAFLFQFFYVRACSFIPISRISGTFYMTIVFTIFLEWIIYSKMPGMSKLLGSFLIIAGGMLAYKVKDKLVTAE